MYDYHDPRQFDETQPRPDVPYGRYASGNNGVGSLIALGIVIAILLAATWFAAA